jgi:dTDP-4-amino-4,6-dideoxy-D-glucose acyltransferase
LIKGKDFYMHKDVYIKNINNAKFGNHVAIDKGFYCTTQIEVGDYVHIAPYNVVIGGNEASLIMKDFSGISAGCRIVCAGDDFASGYLMNPQVPKKYRKVINSPVVFERFSCAGVNSVVLPGVTLAEGSVVGANSTLTKSTEPWTIYVGSPARPVKIRPKNYAYDLIKELGYEI